MAGDVEGRAKSTENGPGWHDHQLNEGRDLALTTDFRSVVGEILNSSAMSVANLTPDYCPSFDNTAQFRALNAALGEKFRRTTRAKIRCGARSRGLRELVNRATRAIFRRLAPPFTSPP